MGHPDLDFIKKFENQQKKGFQFILSKVQSDGGIYGKGLASYNTSICMMALLQAKNPEFEKIIKSARRFLINQQSDFDRKEYRIIHSMVESGMVQDGHILIFPIPTLPWRLFTMQRKHWRIKRMKI